MTVSKTGDEPGGHSSIVGERRQSERQLIKLRAEVIKPAVGTGIIYTRDVSDRGAFLVIPPEHCPPVGTTITLRIFGMFRGEAVTELGARVVRVTDAGLGLQFFDIDFG